MRIQNISALLSQASTAPITAVGASEVKRNPYREIPLKHNDKAQAKAYQPITLFDDNQKVKTRSAVVNESLVTQIV